MGARGRVASLVFGFEMFRAKVFGAHVETTTTTKTIGVLVVVLFLEASYC